MKEDKTLTCTDCGKEFIFTGAEQEFYDEKGFQNLPKRCPSCRAARKQKANGQQREMFNAVCANCGSDTLVPFRPAQEKPVYCRDCYNKLKDTGRI